MDDLVKIKKTIDQIKTEIAIRENECSRLLSELQQLVDIEAIEDVAPILERLESDIKALQSKSDKIKQKLEKALGGLS